MAEQYTTHECAVCGDTITTPRPNEVHIDCAYFRLVRDILK
jgi:hypothetical protein